MFSWFSGINYMLHKYLVFNFSTPIEHRAWESLSTYCFQNGLVERWVWLDLITQTNVQPFFRCSNQKETISYMLAVFLTM